jgi:uncharacterized membrane protein
MIRIGFLISLACLIAACALAAWGWFATPEGAQIPVHFGPTGEADRYGGKAEALLTMPAFLAGLTLLMSIVPKIDPRGDNVRRSRGVLVTAWIIGAVTLLGAQVMAVYHALGGSIPPDMMSRGVVLFIVVTSIVIGLVIARARPNFFVGVRTPWTLSSDLSWDKTHRWASRVFLGIGLLGLVAFFLLPAPTVTIGLVAAMLAGSLGLAVYSWWVWKNDPKRETLSPDDA